MNKRLNVKLLLGLVLGSSFFVVGVYFLHDFQVARKASGLIRRADVALEKQDFDEAVRLLRRFLSHRRDDKEVLKKLALTAKRGFLFKVENNDMEGIQKQLALTRDYMEYAIREGDDDSVLLRETADLYLKIGNWKEAAAHLKTLVESGGPDVTLEDRLNLARASLQMGGEQEQDGVTVLSELLAFDPTVRRFKDPEALSAAEKATYQPQQADAYQMLAAYYREKRLDLDTAMRVVDKLVEETKTAKAYLIRAGYREIASPDARGRAAAQADIEQARAIDPHDEEAVLAYVQLLQNQGKLDEAQTLLQELIGKSPDHPRLYVQLSRVQIQRGETAAAAAVIDDGLKVNPRDANLIWTKAQLQIDQRDYAGLEKSMARLKQVGATDVNIQFLEGRRLVAQGKWLAGSQILERIRPLMDLYYQLQIDFSLAQCYYMLEKPDLRLLALQKIVQTFSTHLPSQMGIAESLQQLGRYDEAYDQWLRVRETYKANGEAVPTRVEASIVDLMVRKQQALPEEKRDWGDVDEQARRILADTSLSSEQRFVLAVQLLAKQGRTEQALKYADQGLKKHPDSYPLWPLRLAIETDKDRAAQILAEMEKQFSDRVPLRLERAKFYARFERDTAKERMRELEQNVENLKIENQASGHEALHAQLYEGLADFHLALGNQEDAVRLLELASKATPRSEKILTKLYEVVLAGTDAEAVKSVVDRLAALLGTQDPTWQTAEAGRLVWMVRNNMSPKSELNRARAMLEQVRNDRRDWAPAILLSADIYELNGDAAGAIKSLEEVLELQPSNVMVLRRLAQRYTAVGRASEAEKLLKRMPFYARSDRDARNQLQLMMRNGGGAEALELARKLLRDSTQFGDQVVYSQVARLAGATEEAVTAARKAVELDPAVPDAWLELVRALSADNKKDEAEAAIQDADLQLPERNKDLVIGQMEAAIGNQQGALNRYFASLRSDPENDTTRRLIAEVLLNARQYEQGLKLVDEILKDAQPNGAEMTVDEMWARRSKAKILAATGSYEDVGKALAMIEQNVPPSGEMAPEDLTLWIGIVAGRPEIESWRRGIEKLEAMKKQRAAVGRRLTDNEQFMLAQLYEKEGNRWPQVESMMVDLLTRDNSNTLMVQTFVGWLLKRGDIRQAEIWARGLPANATIRIRTEAHALAKAGKHQEAANKLLTLMPKEITGESYRDALTVTALIEELGKYNDLYYQVAEREMRRVVEKSPRDLLRLANLIGEYHDPLKISEALAICESAVGEPYKFTASDAGSVAVAILRGHQDELNRLRAQVERVGKWLVGLSQQAPSDYDIKARLAEYYDLVGDTDKVRAEYDDILAHAPTLDAKRKGMIQNNLAYALALDGRGQEALGYIQDAIKNYGPTPDLLDTRGYVYLVAGNAQKAIEDFELALQGASANSHRLFHLALAYDRAGDKQQAKKYWGDALKMDLTANLLPLKLRDEFETLQREYGVTVAPETDSSVGT